MAGYTDHAFRLLCKQQGADLVCTELVSSHALHYGNQKTYTYMDWSEEERPVACQIFGGEPEYMAEAARLVVAHGADMVDINLGCSVPKVLRTGACAAILRDLPRLRDLLRAVVSSVPVPVTVKTRSGWDQECINAIQVAEICQEEGVSALALHARTAKQGFTGASDWGLIAAVKRAVTLPIIGSGDVTDPEAAARMVEQTGCDGLMIGRAAQGNPWIFRRVRSYLHEGVLLPLPSHEDRLVMLLRHARIMVEDKGERIGLSQLRCQASHYVRDMPNASGLRQAMMAAGSLAEVETLLLGAVQDLGAGSDAPRSEPEGATLAQAA
jgi:nifR3 family TIM-barrel protein